MQCQIQIIFVLILNGCDLLKVMVGSVAVFPYIVVGSVRRVTALPPEYPLMVIGAPADTKAKVVSAAVIGVVALHLGGRIIRVALRVLLIRGNNGIIGVVDMGDAHRSLTAAKAHVIAYPHHIAGEIIDIAHTRAACGSGGIVPVAFRTIVVSENHLQNGTVG